MEMHAGGGGQWGVKKRMRKRTNEEEKLSKHFWLQHTNAILICICLNDANMLLLFASLSLARPAHLFFPVV